MDSSRISQKDKTKESKQSSPNDKQQKEEVNALKQQISGKLGDFLNEKTTLKRTDTKNQRLKPSANADEDGKID